MTTDARYKGDGMQLSERLDEYVRAWAIQLLTDDSAINAFQPAAVAQGAPSRLTLRRFA